MFQAMPWYVATPEASHARTSGVGVSDAARAGEPGHCMARIMRERELAYLGHDGSYAPFGRGVGCQICPRTRHRQRLVQQDVCTDDWHDVRKHRALERDGRAEKSGRRSSSHCRGWRRTAPGWSITLGIPRSHRASSGARRGFVARCRENAGTCAIFASVARNTPALREVRRGLREEGGRLREERRGLRDLRQRGVKYGKGSVKCARPTGRTPRVARRTRRVA